MLFLSSLLRKNVAMCKMKAQDKNLHFYFMLYFIFPEYRLQQHTA